MILLDTDHLTVLRYAEDKRCANLTERLTAAEDQHIAVTVVSFEEQAGGWRREAEGRNRSNTTGMWKSVGGGRLAPGFDRVVGNFR